MWHFAPTSCIDVQISNALTCDHLLHVLHNNSCIFRVFSQPKSQALESECSFIIYNVCTHDFLKTYVHVQLPNLGFVSGPEAMSTHLKDIKEFKFAHTQRGGCSRFGIIARGVVDNENLRCQENGYILSNRAFAESLNSQQIVCK